MELPLELRPPELLTREELSFLKFCGPDVRIFHGSRLVPPELISIGERTQIDEGVRVFAGRGVRIGRFVHLALNSVIFGGGECEIGDFVSVGVGVCIITGSDLPSGGLTNPTIPLELRAVERSNVTIGRHALLYTGALILPGIEIPEGTVISAGGIVHKSLKPWMVYAGNPLVQVAQRDPSPILAKANELLAQGKPSHG
jgi:acetyltransferase-like isoleucine patch superfamily enzyme